MGFLDTWSIALLFGYFFTVIVLFVVSTSRFIRRKDGGRVPAKGETARQVCGIVFSICSLAVWIVAGM